MVRAFLKYFFVMALLGTGSVVALKGIVKKGISVKSLIATEARASSNAMPAPLTNSDFPGLRSLLSRGSPKIDVVIASDSTLPASQVQGISESIQKLSSEEAPLLLSKGVRKIVIRPLWSERGFIELLAYTKSNVLVGAFLMKDKAAGSEANLRRVLSSMWFSNRGTSKGKLVISAVNSHEIRAYLNGYPLTGSNSTGVLAFDLTAPNMANYDRATLAVTGDKRPLIRSILMRSDLSRVHRWNLPRPSKKDSHLARN